MEEEPVRPAAVPASGGEGGHAIGITAQRAGLFRAQKLGSIYASGNPK
jgi:hypothetical protein